MGETAERTAVEATIWTDAARAATAASVLERMSGRVRAIGVGGPRAQAVAELARSLDTTRHDELRQLVVDRPARFLLLCAMEAVDLADLQSALAQGTTVLALEPPAVHLQDLAALRGSAAATTGGRVVIAPAFAQSPGYVSAAEPMEAIGERRLVACESVGRPAHGSLVARLFDAWRTLLRFVTTPASVDAALVGGGLADVTPRALRTLTGALTVHARTPDGSAAVIHVADRAGRPRRALHVLGDAGELRVSDGGYSLHQLDGTVLDEDRPGAEVDHPELVAHQWRRLLDRPAADELPGHRDTHALACQIACLLSARTGEPESPLRVLEMNR